MTSIAWLPKGVDSRQIEGDGYELTRLGMPLADHLAAKRVAGRAEKTLRDRRAYVGAFALMWPDLAIADVEGRHCLHYFSALHARGLAVESLRIRFTHLNDFFEWCVAWDLMPKNPMRGRIEPPRRGAKKVYDIFSDAECKALIDLPLIDGCLMEIMLDAGLRRSECKALQVRRVRHEPHYGELAILNSKFGKDRTVGMTRHLAGSIAMLRQEALLGDADYFWYTRVNQGRTVKRTRAIGDGSFQRWWWRCLDDAGVRRRNPHLTRHTFATRWLRKGGRLETLSMVMGHASIATTKDLYGHLDSSDVWRDLLLMEAMGE